MNSIRVHSSVAEDPEHPSYLVLTFSDPDRISIDLTPLVGDLGLDDVTFSQEVLYDLLSGQDLVLSLPDAGLVFCPRGEELVIVLRADARNASSEYRVWLAEVALGWNMLTRSSNRWI
ncbi:MAG: hypothetical protein ACO1SV_08590 [Fimbriimonas sp.]